MDKYGNTQNDYFNIYISTFHGDKSKSTQYARKSELKKNFKNNVNHLSVREFKVWKIYYVTYYLDAIQKYNIEPDLIDYRFNKDKNSLLVYLKQISISDLDQAQHTHSLHSQKSALISDIVNGKRNKFINNFLEYDRMVYVFNNRKLIK